jgi:hypothetical protein
MHMRQALRYLRRHPWQRRALTAAVAMVLGMTAAVLVYPIARDHLLIRDLGSDDPRVRSDAAAELAAIARRSQATLHRLERALGTDSDARFSALAAVLVRLRQFDVPRRDRLWIDRHRALRFESVRRHSPPKAVARWLLTDQLLCGRDNRYVRRLLAAASGDEFAPLRELAAALAARLGDDAAIRRLLADDEPRVAAAAALDAAIAERAALAEDIAALIERRGGLDVISAAAYALAKLAPTQYAPRLCDMLPEADEPRLRDRLLHVMTVLDGPSARRAVRDVLASSRAAGRPPSAMALVAAGKLNVAEAGRDVRDVLAAAARPGSAVNRGQLRAALLAAKALRTPARPETYAVCDGLWSAELDHTLVAAARVLAEQAKLEQPDRPDAPTPEQCIALLRKAALWAAPSRGPGPDGAAASGAAAPTTSRAATTPPAARATPLASAAAAIALWSLRPSASQFKTSAQDSGRRCGEVDTQSSAYFVRLAARHESTLPGDLIAWHLARSGRTEAFQLGLEMLPPPLDPARPPEAQPPRVYSRQERAAGAMLLALSARTEQQIRQAVRRIESRLIGGRHWREQDFYERGAYRCALLILGQRQQARAVRELLEGRTFPQRRALTALLAAGAEDALRWLFWDVQVAPRDVAMLLVDRHLGEVLAAAAPSLPAVDIAASEDLLLWQLRILRDFCAIRQGTLNMGLTR